MVERSQGEDGRHQASVASRRGQIGVFADEWAAALAGVIDVSLSSAKITELLSTLAVDALAVVLSDPFQPERAAKIGTALVDANFVDADVLGRSLTVISRNVALEAAPRRVSAVQEAVAAGYVRAVRDRILAEAERTSQEALRTSEQALRTSKEALRSSEAALRSSEVRFRTQLRHQALHDPLTGTANRALFLDRLASAVAEPAGRIGICYLDLDGFTSVNDTLGHDVGDELLVAVAERLGHRVAASNGTVARIGGDEFILLVEHSGGIDAMVTLAGDVLAGIEQPFSIGTHRLCITASIGIVERPVAKARASDLVKDADSALSWAKAEGPGRWAVYDPARQASDNVRMTLTASMRSALENDEFTVVYQPIVALPGGELRGLEALLRWNHPTLGVLSPEAFIALAESSGVITPLGRWVMETACRQAAEWQRIRPMSAPFISVNLSAQQATNPGFVGDVARIIADAGLPAELLQLELTESALVEADSRPLEALQKLSAMGVRIAADDFGSGYSNLAYLRRLPVDALKLSASFIKELWPNGPADEPVISALAGLAHTLGLDVTVEGVETSEQASCLAALGCDTAQGWYFASALSGDDITAVLRGSSRLCFPRYAAARPRSDHRA